MAQQLNRFSNMSFPEYTFQEYPKKVGEDKDGKMIVAHNSAEEEILLNRLKSSTLVGEKKLSLPQGKQKD